MVNQQALAHHWSEVRDQIKEKWNRLSSEDLPSLPGNVDQLIGRIHQKTGESRETIEEFLASIAGEGKDLAESARERVEHGAEQVKDAARRGVERVRQGYAEAEHAARRHPGQAVAVAFGLGLVCGLGAAILLSGSRRRPATRLERGRAAGQRFAEQLRETLAACMPSR